ncbi:hypothetical protein [Methylovulum miyakonense]|uniref:hypothetical protein n=1 Tax=Methylovulum miyakonense TaxID=645578 RepID=UPI00039C1CE5|nr:hypothetical protein [Methylovulum miyakonense]
MSRLLLKMRDGVLPAAAIWAVAGYAMPMLAMAGGEGGSCPKAVSVSPALPSPQSDGSTGGIDLCAGAVFAWNAFISVNWPAKEGVRDEPDTNKPFGQGSPTVWETMRAKVELYPGNGSPTNPPHGVQLNQQSAPSNPPDYGYNQAPDYVYSPSEVKSADGHIKACPKQPEAKTAAWIPLDETTQIGNNQTFAGVLPERDANGLNSKPQLIRYAVKMNKATYTNVVSGQYWYHGDGSPLGKAANNYKAALQQGQEADPASPYVNFGSTDPKDPNYSVEIKSAWRPLTDKEAASGRFYRTTVRYYEEDGAGTPCYREDTWGLVGMHLISFPISAPWVIWSTFEQTDNILAANNSATEDAEGRVVLPTTEGPTTPLLSSNPDALKPVVSKTGDYCTQPGARLFFRENPNYGTLPADGDICVNKRWHPIPDPIIEANVLGHQAIRSYLKSLKGSPSTSPWLYYKLVNVQATPVDYSGKDDQRFSTTPTYYTANATIETDYSLGMFTGDLVNGVPSNKVANGDSITDYYNTRLLPFQAGRLGFLKTPIRMGGCGGCHGYAATQGQDFSFALGDNVKKPEPVNAFKNAKTFRNYKP